ncbi:protein regulator of cytokinesis 1b isoform X2 [Brienomyrus brachyistius]|uniref:protein regulator of cytokinesis 1b isoform X2 n=1 Tax=Brienomyrus brachyistius TaxID=42636 RepID=UPI0020B38BCA|nr:protein regulator of cytokinesis 1b isoform X2 [Brienomyrus brachyistius]
MLETGCLCVKTCFCTALRSIWRAVSCPLGEVLAAESVACLNKALCHLKDIWEEIGIPEDQRLQRTAVVKSHVKGLLDMMIAEEDDLRGRLVSSIESCRRDLDALCMELQLPLFKEEEGHTMLQQEKDIRTRVEAAMTQKKQRMQELRALLLQEQVLCDILRMDTHRIDHEAVPSLGQLDTYRHHVANLSAEKERRHAEFVSIKKDIISRMEDLDRLPDTSFEREVICEDEEAFCLSEENISSLKLLLAQLEEQKVENELLCDAYRAKVRELWDTLQVSQKDREVLADHMIVSRKRNMDALQAEVTRLEVLRLQSIRDLTEAKRVEVAQYWEKCFFSIEQRRTFVPYYDDDFTEELLNLHESEVQRLKQHHQEHQELFEGVQRWEDSWRLYLDLERKATDPSRFTNRGGNLLKEEKQRADLHKSLPKLEKNLKAQIDAWEKEEGREFLVNGQKFLQYVEEQWEVHRTEKEQEKLQRQLKKSKQMEEEMLYGTAPRTPSKRRLPGAQTPGKVRKRGPVVLTPGRGKPLRVSLLERNKENAPHLNVTTLGGASRPRAGPQCHLSANSVTSSCSEIAKEFVNVESALQSMSV